VGQTEAAKAEAAPSRLAATIRPWPDLLVGAPCWAALMGLAATFALYRRERLYGMDSPALITLLFLGGLLAWPLAVSLARFLAYRRPFAVKFVVFVVLLSLGTLGMTAALFALDYGSYYERWHAPFGSLVWFFQFAFTSASAVYQFAVLGTRLFLPLAPVFAIAAGLFLARRMS